MQQVEQQVDASSEPEITRPEDVLRDAFERFDAHRIAISFSGAEDVVVVDMAHRLLGSDLRVFSLDTGRLHPETYRFMETVRDHYGIEIELLMPDASAVEHLVREKGLFSFLSEGHGECCAIRKIQPLRKKLGSLDAWITGQRKDQSVTRVSLPTEQVDSAFSTRSHTLTKFNPLADWTLRDVWSYIRAHDVPYNPLHQKGFVSVGCEPCTRATMPHQHEREGRWWWENDDDKECGLHAQNVQPVKIIA